MTATRRRSLLTAAATLALPAIVRAATEAEISFYFPVAAGGPISKIIDGHAADFQRENPAIKVTPIYAGTYQDTLTKAQTALRERPAGASIPAMSRPVRTRGKHRRCETTPLIFRPPRSPATNWNTPSLSYRRTIINV